MIDKLKVTFVVGGQPVTHEFPPNEPLHAAVRRVLGETHNTGQPIENWVLTFEGRTLDTKQTLSDARIPGGATLFLNIRTGRGGSHVSPPVRR